MMDLLPSSHQEFATSQYWDSFFKKRGGKAFEWYGEYPELCGILHKYMKLRDHTLVVGCGNSSLSADLYDVGYEKLVNIDISEVVVRQMTDRNAKARPNMKFLLMDILHTEFSDGEFNVVLDKGTLDALMTDSNPDTLQHVRAMFAEIVRVLRVGGRYICITLAQEHILNEALRYFSQEGWLVRVCRVAEAEIDDSREMRMPVFVFVFTKFKKMPNFKPVLEVAYFDDQVQRQESIEALIQSVKAMQYYGMVRQTLNKQSQSDEQVSVDLFSAAAATPRYTLHVVDSACSTGNRFAVFIVPEGRETEWLFSTDEGRTQLAKSAGFSRLLVATLHPDHKYEGMEQVKAELSSKVMELAPPDLGSKQVPFLSLGDDINKRTVRYRGNSELSGDFVVEDVDIDGSTRRRLIFLKNRNLVQSEALLTKQRKKSRKKKADGSSELRVDVCHLCEGHNLVLVAGLALLEDAPDGVTQSQLSTVLIGVGGGSVAAFLHHFFPMMNIEGVELDPSMVQVATNWFQLAQDDRLKLHVADGIDYIHSMAAAGQQCDVMIIDVDNKEPGSPLSGPPRAFVQPELLETINKTLKPSGVLMLNLSSGNSSVRNDVLQDLKKTFKRMYIVDVPEQVNKIVFALPTTRNSEPVINAHKLLPESTLKSLELIQKQISRGLSENSVQDILRSLKGLSLVE